MPGSFDDIGFSAGSCGSEDGYDYWDHVAERHREHRRHIRNLLVLCALVTALGIVVHPGFFVCAAVPLPLVLIEWWAARKSRATASADRTAPIGRT